MIRPSSANGSAAHVDAYVSTGTSPGRTGRTSVAVDTDHGGPIESDLAWEVHGPAHAPPVLVLGGISAGHHLLPTATDTRPGWWPDVVGPGGALDPRRQRLVGIEFLGGAASSPLDHPVTTGDQARAFAAVLDAVGAPDVSVVGASYGGMVALAFATLFPDRTRRVVTLSAAHRAHPMATALRAVQRSAVRLGIEVGRAEEALALARGLAMTTYRSTEEFESRFGRDPRLEGGWARFPVEAYLRARGHDFASRFTPGRFLRLSESIDLHELDPADLETPTTAVSFDTDTLVPPWLVEELAASSGGACRHVRLRSVFGHDAFLKESGGVSDVVRDALAGGEATDE